MTKKILNLFLAATLVGLVAFSFVNADKDKALLDVLTQSLNSSHYSPRQIDDEFSKNVFNLYLERIDYGKRFLLQEDVNLLKAYENQIDNEIAELHFEFFNTSNEIFEKRISEVEAYFKDILAQPFDFKVNEEYESNPEKMDFAKNQEELKEYWRKYLKFATLERLNDMQQEQEKAIEKKDTAYKVKTFAEMEENARKKVLKTHEDWYRRLTKLDKNDRFSVYLNCITSIYDPHTGYYPPKEKENFDISMSGQLEGIGATLTESDGYIKIVDIVPGSPSSRIEDITVNTLILKVAQGSEEPVDVVDMRLDDAVKLIRGKKGTEVQLTIKKVDGTIKTVSIIRDVINLEETYAKSAIIKDEKGKNSFGYIYLPKFYADFNKAGGRFSAKDILTEIETLKNENIEGLILDLRDNGGGSLADAVEMSGYFVEEGPIVQVKAKVGKPQILNDTDRRMQWEGSLIVLVNSLSASASEILAAALQDYGRAIIVGSPTFGKGTVQRFFDLDYFVSPEQEDVKPLGAIKLTIQKFYRINGGSTQLKGVIPDILLPDEYQYAEISERDQDFPMEWTEINSVLYKNYERVKNLEKLRSKSKARVEKNQDFILISEKADWIKNQKDNSLNSLNLEKAKIVTKKENELNEKFKKIGENKYKLQFFSTKEETLRIKNDSIRSNTVQKWHAQLQKDAYINECIAILKDLE